VTPRGSFALSLDYRAAEQGREGGHVAGAGRGGGGGKTSAPAPKIITIPNYDAGKRPPPTRHATASA